MQELLVIVVIVVLWFVLTRFLLPGLGLKGG